MMIDWSRAAQICDEHFFSSGCSENDLRDWLAGSIESWVDSGSIISFSPFEDFFPDTEREERCLAAIGNNLRRKKRKGELFAPKTIFSKALTYILAKKGFYLHNVKAWEFALRMAQEMALDETVETLTRLIGYDDFRAAHNEGGYDLFSAAFDVVETFRSSAGAPEFWKKCLAHIDKYPSLSLRLLVNLIQADSINCQRYVSESNMAKAVELYRKMLMSSLDTRHLSEFDIAAEKISNALNDNLYRKYIDACASWAHYLIIWPRAKTIQEVEGDRKRHNDIPTTIDINIQKLITAGEFNPRASAGNMAQESPALS